MIQCFGEAPKYWFWIVSFYHSRIDSIWVFGYAIDSRIDSKMNFGFSLFYFCVDATFLEFVSDTEVPKWKHSATWNDADTSACVRACSPLSEQLENDCVVPHHSFTFWGVHGLAWGMWMDGQVSPSGPCCARQLSFFLICVGFGLCVGGWGGLPRTLGAPGAVFKLR